MRYDARIGEEVAYHSYAWGWRFGKVIGRHCADTGLRPSYLEMATVRFRAERGFLAEDVALPCFLLHASK